MPVHKSDDHTATAHGAAKPVDLFTKCYEWPVVKKAMAEGYYPYFTPITGEQGEEVVIRGKRFIMLGSNNYLGLTNDPRVKEAAREAILKYGVGCTGSRFLNGTLDLHLKLEAELAAFLKKPAALVFSTGYQTNLGIIASLVGKDDVVISDRLNHASIFDGCRMAYGKTLKYRHDDLADLERLLKGAPARAGKLVVVDGVFSMEGTCPNLKRIVELCHQYTARLMVDEAHGLGVLGEGGRGACEEQGVLPQVDVIMGTFSKSFASIGGVAAGDQDVIVYIKHLARAMIFSAALPPPAIATVLKCLEILKAEPDRRKRLLANADLLRNGLRGIGFNVGNSVTPIVPVLVGRDDLCFALWKGLFEEGIFVNPVVAPATPPGHALLRVSTMATHTPAILNRALEKFKAVGTRLGVLGGR
ncbi:MAG: aminotransferase class I/II-fold pyridoxal phosphate-dependent enzyme [Candidatus Coatesbacteria bacterium]